MTMSRQAEEITNAALASLLRPMLPGYAVRSETTPTIAGSPGRHPDILVTAPGSAPVILEAEYEPNANPEADALPRLGAAIIGEPRPVESVIALRYPEELAAAYDLPAALASARIGYCVLYENGDRFPAAGWLYGGAADLADLIRLDPCRKKPWPPPTTWNGASNAPPMC